MSSTEHIHSAWGLGACVLAAHVEAICPGECHLLPQSREGSEAGANVLSCCDVWVCSRRGGLIDDLISRLAG